MKSLKITNYRVPAAGKLPRGKHFRLVFISDLHNLTFGTQNQNFLSAVRKAAPDAVLIGGDQIVAKPGESLDPGLSLAEILAEEFPVFYAPGNHEYRLKLYPDVYGNLWDQFLKRIRNSKVTFLENRFADFYLNGCPVRILGFEMDRKYYQRFYRSELPEEELLHVFGKADPERYTILLAHHPGYQSTYFSYGADLTLSGHYHGGVVGFGTHYGLITPDFRLFSPYCRGLFQKDGHIQIVSGGTGEHTIPFRIHNPRELIVITVEGGREECQYQ